MHAGIHLDTTFNNDLWFQNLLNSGISTNYRQLHHRSMQMNSINGGNVSELHRIKTHRATEGGYVNFA